MLKRYIIFTFDEFHPIGGWHDVLLDGIDESGTLLVHSFATLKEAEDVANNLEVVGNKHIVDLHTGQIVG